MEEEVPNITASVTKFRHDVICSHVQFTDIYIASFKIGIGISNRCHVKNNTKLIVPETGVYQDSYGGAIVFLLILSP